MVKTIKKLLASVMLVLMLIAAVFAGFVNTAETTGALSVTNVAPYTKMGSVDGGDWVVIGGNFALPTDVVQVSAGSQHTCVLDLGGRAYCWGNNGGGRLGNNSTSNSSIPVAVNTSGVLSDKVLTQISAGDRHTCALDLDGKAYCWGKNESGQLGNGTTADSSVPAAVNTVGALNGKTLTQISAGYNHTCAIDSGGRTYCWGNDNQGQINNSGVSQSAPINISTHGDLNGKTIVQVSAGNMYTCALDSGGDAYCWGEAIISNCTIFNNSLDEPLVTCLGYEFDGPRSIKHGIIDDKTLTQISAGYDRTCVLDSDGYAYCWGYKGTLIISLLGDGLFGVLYEFISSYTPAAVDTSGVLDGKTLTQINAGRGHICAAGSDNLALDDQVQVFCWGSGVNGQLGNGATTDSAVPVAVNTSGVLDGKTLTQMSANGDHACVLDVGGHAYCWGANSNGQLGNNSSTNSQVPVKVHALFDDDYTVIFDPLGTPAECINVVRVGGWALHCVTTAHAAGRVDVAVSDGVSTETLTNAYKYAEDWVDYDLRWNRNFGGSDQDYFFGVTATNDGGAVAVGGGASDDFDMLGLTIRGGRDAIIARYDKDGTRIWENNFGGSGFDYFWSVKLTPDGGYVAVGTSCSDDGDLAGKNRGGCDAIIAKFDSGGTLMWNENFGGSGSGEIFNSVAVTSDGGYIAVGEHHSTDGDLAGIWSSGQYGLVVKYSSDGTVEYAKVTDKIMAGVDATPDGGYITVSNDRHSANATIKKWNADGEVEWSKQYSKDGYAENHFNAVVATKDGNYIAVGYIGKPQVLVGNAGGSCGSGGDNLIVKFDSSGNVVWEKDYGGSDCEELYAVDIVPKGGIVVAGRTESVDGIYEDLFAKRFGGTDSVIARHNDAGELMWIKKFGGGAQDAFYGVVASSDGGYIAVGTAFDRNGILDEPSRGGDDATIAKWFDSESPEEPDDPDDPNEPERPAGAGITAPNTGLSAIQIGSLVIIGLLAISITGILIHKFSASRK
ncbi:hypothetical protein FWF74_02700 [Candidatus Saccharibacteria bacterium]|nr:hypothetical protein [Candidatus Saccharibacteria bacterium]MCL1962736.1 hypothetical protein [Candidatus Saccharibacteria bacterium]